MKRQLIDVCRSTVPLLNMRYYFRLDIITLEIILKSFLMLKRVNQNVIQDFTCVTKLNPELNKLNSLSKLKFTSVHVMFATACVFN